MAAEERRDSGPGAVLVIRNGSFAGMRYDLTSEETLIGRTPTTDITLLDEGISREHALILHDAETGTYTIEDLQSTNGTKVNGKRVRSFELSEGDEIEIGHTVFQFSRSEPGEGAG
ncbi:MAG: FHA domain-containing protein [Deltaproteobacteria bacterium]|nr:MAG: FHA domain-containing protein [Deltaproteobacteria bacterium]